MKVDMELRDYVCNYDTQKLGCAIVLPAYSHPFTIFTDKEVMLLWAKTENEREMWVHAFKSLLLTSDQGKVESFRVKLTSKNKMVVGLYHCLKQIDSDELAAMRSAGRRELDNPKQRSKTTVPKARGQNLANAAPSEPPGGKDGQ